MFFQPWHLSGIREKPSITSSRRPEHPQQRPAVHPRSATAPPETSEDL
jgi:hypothetical protein